MKKLKIYLDTSVISHLLHEDTPEKQADTLKLWERIKQGEYEVYMSYVTIYEISQCKEELKNKLMQFVNEIDVTILPLTDEVKELANKIVKWGILTEKSIDDCRHIACAVIQGCEIIVSWNMKHLVNVKTVNGVRGVSLSEGYRTIDIGTPQFLIGADEDDS
jgi:predicted nucleic acid-binding protein